MGTLNIQAAESLRRVRKRIEKLENWTRVTMARDKNGELTDPRSPLAITWCLLGALAKEQVDCMTVWDALRKQSGEYGISYFNDSHTHAEVLALVDETIKELEA